MKELQKLIDAEIKKAGIPMSKLIQSAYYGLFSSSDAVYDRRIAYSYKSACELSDDGFSISSINVGTLLLNAIMRKEK
jgi:hypothetical protein